MRSSSFEVPRLAAVLLCVALSIPATLPAQSGAPQGTASSVAPMAEPGAKAPAQLLSDDELESLAARSKEPGPEVRGGALSNEHLTYIVIALAAIVLVLVLK